LKYWRKAGFAIQEKGAFLKNGLERSTFELERAREVSTATQTTPTRKNSRELERERTLREGGRERERERGRERENQHRGQREPGRRSGAALPSGDLERDAPPEKALHEKQAMVVQAPVEGRDEARFATAGASSSPQRPSTPSGTLLVGVVDGRKPSLPEAGLPEEVHEERARVVELHPRKQRRGLRDQLLEECGVRKELAEEETHEGGHCAIPP
jgi:hypothetical protein